MKTFKHFLHIAEQEASAASQTTPTKPVEKSATQKSSPKVYDPGRGVDVDDKGRWKGDIINTPKTKSPETKKIDPAKSSGPDESLPAGEANPKKKKGDYEFDTSKMEKDAGKTAGTQIWQSPDGKTYTRPAYDEPDTTNWPSIKKPGSGGPVLWPTPGVYKGGQGRGV
jgi:hypothetical protein